MTHFLIHENAVHTFKTVHLRYILILFFSVRCFLASPTKTWYYFSNEAQLGAHYFLVYLFKLLYMFQATMCPSSGELTVSMRHWYFCTLYGWLSGQQNRQPPIQSEKIPVSQRYSHFSWWWAHSCPKHVQKLK